MCKKANSILPKKDRPSCRSCKKFPKVGTRNRDIAGIYLILLTMSVEPNIGLVKYDSSFIECLFDLLEVEEDRRSFAAKALLRMVQISTDGRLKKMSEEHKKRDMERQLEELKLKHRR